MKRVLQYISIGSLFLLAGFLCFRLIHSPDIGFHIKAGNWIIDNLHFPVKDTFTYTLNQNDYIDIYWLYQVVFAFVNRWSGESGIVVLNALLVLVTLALCLYRIRRNGVPNNALLWVMLFFAILSASLNFEPRPHQISWIYLSLILLVLERYYIDRTCALFWLPLIMLLWVNTHPLFIIGWVVMVCFCVGIWWENKRILDKHLSKFIIASLLICFVNPYFHKGVFLPLEQYSFLQEGSGFKESISEYTSVFSAEAFKSYIVNGKLVLFQPIVFLHAFAILALALFVLQIKRQKLHNILLFAAFFFILAMAVKNTGYFVFALLPIIVAQPVDVSVNKQKPRQTATVHFVDRLTKLLTKPNVKIPAAVFIVLASLITILRVSTNAYYIGYRSPERFGFDYNKNILPVQASPVSTRSFAGGKASESPQLWRLSDECSAAKSIYRRAQ